MIDRISKFHSELEKGESVKIITALDNYTTYLNRTDVIKPDPVDGVLEIYRANGAKVALNVDFVVSICVVVRL